EGEGHAIILRIFCAKPARRDDEVHRLKLLLVNPPIYDFTAYDFWLRPYGLLRVAGRLRTCDLTAFDYLVSRHRDDFGRGQFDRQLISKPAPLSDVPRRF